MLEPLKQTPYFVCSTAHGNKASALEAKNTPADIFSSNDVFPILRHTELNVA